jgi:hypothetical protein
MGTDCGVEKRLAYELKDRKRQIGKCGEECFQQWLGIG